VIVAIDGPAGAGKSTIARAVADKLGWDYLDTGAMYRAIALLALEQGVPPDDREALARIARTAGITATGDVVLVDGRDVTERIRADDVTRAVSRIAVVPGVRRAMAAVQRRAADSGNVVMEGRDIGSVVAPHAEVKIFLTATPDERALRRVRQTGLAPTADVVAKVRASIEERDARDASRTESPLMQTPDAVHVDTTDMTVDEVVARIAGLVAERAAG
jgi:CMP/dCMP kinase